MQNTLGHKNKPKVLAGRFHGPTIQYETISKMPLMAVLLVSLSYELARASDVFQVNVNVVSAFGAGLVIVWVPISVVL
jgi:hypothetical protein